MAALVSGLAHLSSPLSSYGERRQPVYTSADLKRQIEERKDRLLLLILGKIYDVSKGKQFYAPGMEYNGYCVGIDHTRAFLNVDFENDGGDDLSTLSPGACLGILHWGEFYVDKDKKGEYPYVGLHDGRFYDRSGQPTPALVNFSSCVARGEVMKAAHAASAAAAPNCTRTPLEKVPARAGTWEQMECIPPAVPRRSGVTGEEQRCICLVPPPADPCSNAAGAQCEIWAKNGECEKNAGYMASKCARTCGLCTPDPRIEPEDEDFPNAPKRYSRCELGASVCSVRTK